MTVGQGGTVGPQRIANPGYEQDLDASRNSTEVNPLTTGKKDVQPGATQPWGTLRYGIPKEDRAFGLPEQSQPNESVPTANVQVSQDALDNQGKGPVSYTKGNNAPGNSVM